MQLHSREANLAGAWALAVAGAVQEAANGEAGASGSLAAALVTIVLFPGERVGALRRVLGLSPAGVVRGVDRLVAAGLARRQTGSGDGREVLVTPTRRGIRSAERILAARASAVNQLLAPLTGPERKHFLALLEKLLSGLTSDRDEARHICRLCDHPACERSWCPVNAGASGEGRRSHPATPLGAGDDRA